jgi:peptidoglycan hydrolase FlgJ
MASSIASSTAAALPEPAQPQPKNAASAAKQFESLMIGEMLRSMRESTADDDDDNDNTKQTMLDMADQQFAQLLANNGGLGMAKMIVTGLNKETQNANQQ